MAPDLFSTHQFFDVVFHDVLAAPDAARILLDGQLLGRALEAEEALDVQLGLLLPTSLKT